MYIMNSYETEVLNSDFVERFCLVEKSDACLIVASYGADRCVTIGRFANKAEASDALRMLYGSLAEGHSYFDVPASTLYAEQTTKKDARTRRRGGS